MSEAQIALPRVLAFVALCVVIGPAIGILEVFLLLLVGGLFVGGPLKFPTFPFMSAMVAVGYVLGAPVAFVAAVIFAIAARRHGRHGLVAASLGAIVAAILVTVIVLIISEQGYYVPSWRLWRMAGGIAAVVFISVVAMTACWLIARALGILAINHETAGQTQQI